MKGTPTYVAPFIVGVMAARGLALHRQGFGGKGLTDDTVDVARRMVEANVDRQNERAEGT